MTHRPRPCSETKTVFGVATASSLQELPDLEYICKGIEIARRTDGGIEDPELSNGPYIILIGEQEQDGKQYGGLELIYTSIEEVDDFAALTQKKIGPSDRLFKKVDDGFW
jgi:hypothetical protein